MSKIKYFLTTFVRGILAGIAIAIGGFLYIKARDVSGLTIVPAFLFPIGLILICNFNFFLYTGKICYLADKLIAKEKRYILELGLGLIGNYLGALFMGLILSAVFKVPDVVYEMVKIKTSYSWWQLLILAIFCGMLIYFAVEAFSKVENNFGKYVILIMCIAGFIICGFEHCIADMFYFSLARDFNFMTFVDILIIIIGNSIGGLFIPCIKRLSNA